MVYKEAIRWEHLEAFRAKRLDEIPAHLLDEVRARCEAHDKANKNKDKKALVVEADVVE